MVWQDLCRIYGYPADTLRDESLAEADYQIKRLRNHPSITLWCGMNEDVYSGATRALRYKHTGRQRNTEVKEGQMVCKTGIPMIRYSYDDPAGNGFQKRTGSTYVESSPPISL